MSSSAYSPHKAFLHPQQMSAVKYGWNAPPVHVQMIISDLCSHNCSFCAYRMEGYTTNALFGVVENGVRNNNPNRMIATEKALEIIDSCKMLGVKAIQFTGGGEPTVHPEHNQIFKAAISAGIEISLVTHGALLKDQSMDTLMAAKWVRVSVDAGLASTYAKIRRVSERQFGAAMDNIRSLVVKKRATGSDVTIGMGFVVTEDNWHEVYVAAVAARDLGVDIFRISAIFQADGVKYFDGWGESAERLCKLCEDLETESFKVANSFGRRVQDLEEGSPDYRTCGYQYFTTYIGADLNVYRCCSTAYSTRGLVGSIKEVPFHVFWNSSDRLHSYNSFNAQGCERCQFNSQNRAINELVQIKHQNFV